MSTQSVAAHPGWRHVMKLIEAAPKVAVGAICYGSIINGASVRPTSALDVILVVDSYPDFWQTLRVADVRVPRFRLLAPILAPTTVLVGGAPAKAKINIVSTDQFIREMSGDARDHFLRGRLSQNVTVPWARSVDARKIIDNRIADARHLSAHWVPAHLSTVEDFTTTDFIETLIVASYRYEIRPEPRSRAREVAATQSAAKT